MVVMGICRTFVMFSRSSFTEIMRRAAHLVTQSPSADVRAEKAAQKESDLMHLAEETLYGVLHEAADGHRTDSSRHRSNH